jgi:hypothetical protein
VQVFVINHSYFLEVGTTLAPFTTQFRNLFVLFDDVSMLKFMVMKVPARNILVCGLFAAGFGSGMKISPWCCSLFY